MKRLILSAVIILSLVVLSSLHVGRMEKLTGHLLEQMETIETALRREDWRTAGNAARSAMEFWEEKAFYLHTTLRHTEIDAIRSSLREVNSYLTSREDKAECLATTAKLVNQLELLVEAELPSLKNLL